ncbi:MAG TPA: 16S rRNA (guanine(966)-N(2))-methyltransferase RsmD, partial [Candidatus Marinimicrobia bacterium]|nr:16S rRNA (guanine(966)-N(2))-methyltransferase RsmD [Candidatus Neomarinimicrobiota bacterium]
MRILSGRFKGHSIKTVSSTSYRPTQSRIRKSLFDILGPLDGLSFLDLYSGSGIIGFEAASRGAADITFVENDYTSFRLLNENAEKFDKNIFSFIKKNVLIFLNTRNKYDI